MYILLTSYFSINQMTNPIYPKLDFINCNIGKKNFFLLLPIKFCEWYMYFFFKCYIYNIINIHSYVTYLNIIIIISSVNFFCVCYFFIFQLFLMNFFYYYYWIVIFCPFFVFFFILPVSKLSRDTIWDSINFFILHIF